jgi:arginase
MLMMSIPQWQGAGAGQQVVGLGGPAAGALAAVVAGLAGTQPSPSTSSRSMALRMLLGEGDTDLAAFVPEPFVAQRVLLVGIPDSSSTSRPRWSGWPWVGWMCRRLMTGSTALIGMLRERGIDKLAIHVDLDVLEPADFPAIGWPSPGGARPAVLVGTLRDLGQSFDVVGVGLTEYRRPELGPLPPAVYWRGTVPDILRQLVAAVQR